MKQKEKKLQIVAIIAAYNEEDVIYHVVGNLIAQGINVYFIDNHSTDNTVREVRKWMGKGLIKLEFFPKDPSEIQKGEYQWDSLLKRKEVIATELEADWILHADGDEYRESPWPEFNLKQAISFVDTLGYNAINFEVFNFCPTNNDFKPGEDVRNYLQYYEKCEVHDIIQVKCWKNSGVPVELASSGGHQVKFENRKIFPIPFILQHYPIRSEIHGQNKIFIERLPRFTDQEKSRGWHNQYNIYKNKRSRFLKNQKQLTLYNSEQVKLKILSQSNREMLLYSTLFGSGNSTYLPCRSFIHQNLNDYLNSSCQSNIIDLVKLSKLIELIEGNTVFSINRSKIPDGYCEPLYLAMMAQNKIFKHLVFKSNFSKSNRVIAEILLHLGKLNFGKNQLIESRKWYKYIILRNQYSEQYQQIAYIALGEIQFLLKNRNWRFYYNEALTILLKKKKKKKIEKYRIASIYKNLMDLNNSIYWFDKVLKSKPNNRLKAGVKFHMGEMAQQEKKNKEAFNFYSRCLEFNNEHICAREKLNEIKSLIK